MVQTTFGTPLSEYPIEHARSSGGVEESPNHILTLQTLINK